MTSTDAANPPDSDSGRAGVSAALVRLEDVEAMPLHERPDAFDEIHQSLRAALAAIDDA